MHTLPIDFLVVLAVVQQLCNIRAMLIANLIVYSAAKARTMLLVWRGCGNHHEVGFGLYLVLDDFTGYH